MTDTFISGFLFGLVISGAAAFAIWAALRRSSDDDEIGFDAWAEDYPTQRQEPRANPFTRQRKIEL